MPELPPYRPRDTAALLAADTVAVVAAYWVVTVLPFSEREISV